MAGYELGNVHGTITIDSDTSGIDEADRRLGTLTRSGQSTGDALGKIGTTMGAAGATLAGGLGVAISTAASLEAELSGIKAVSGATAPEMDKIHDAALRIGKDTTFSASEAAAAMSELAKAGIPIEDILNGAADATVALAAATGVDMPTAAGIASNAMNVFGIGANEMDRVVNTFAQTANASAIDVTDLGQSMQAVGAVAALAGLSMEDTTMAIGQLGDAGIKGSDAGTSLKTMFMNLQPSTKEATAAMKDLGLITEDGTNQFYDQEGKLKSLRDIQGLLNGATKDLTAAQKQQALETIFGSDAIRAAAVLADGGAVAYDNFGAKMAATGSAADQAKIRQDNMKGSLEQLKGALETAGIIIGEQLIPPLTRLIDWAGQLVDKFAALSPETQKLIMQFSAGAAGLLLFAGGFIKAVQFAQSFVGSISTVINALFRRNAAENTSMLTSIRAAAASAAAWVSSAAQTVALWAMYAAEAVANATRAAAAWVAQTARAAAAMVASGAQMVASAAATAASIVASWVAAAAQAIAQWVLMAARATAQAAIIAAQWLLTAGASAATALASLAVSVATTVAGWVAMAAASVFNALIIAAQWLIAFWPVVAAVAIFAGIVLLVVMYWDEIVAAFKAAGAWIAQIMAAAWAAVQQAWDWIVGKFVEAKDLMSQAMQAAWAAIQQAWDWITEKFSQAKDLIGEAMSAAWEAIKAAWDWIGQKFGEARDLIGTIFSAIWTFLVNTWNNIVTTFQNAGTSVWNAMKQTWTWIQEVWNAVISYIQEIPGKISAVFSGAINWLLGAGQNILQGLWNGITAIWNNVSSWFGQVYGWVTSFFASAGSWLLGAGQNLINGILQGIYNTWNNIFSAFNSLYSSITGWFSGAASWLVGAGMDLIRGLMNGIGNMAGAAVQKAKDVASSAINGVKNLLGIGSPSKVFTQFGEWTSEGLAIGLENGEKGAVRAAISTAQQVINGVQDTLDGGKGLTATIGAALSPGAIAGLGGSGPMLAATLDGMATGSRPMAAGGSSRSQAATDAEFQRIIKMEFNTYNPVAERASDNEARKIRAAAAVGSF